MTMRSNPSQDLLRYRICGLTLRSDSLLPELAPAIEGQSENDGDITILFSNHRRREFASPLHWFMSGTTPSGKLWMSCAKGGGRYLIRFPGLADFSVDRDGRHIVCTAGSQAPPDTLRHLLLDHVLPLSLTLQGHQVLHATAVLTPHGVCAFTGSTGTGKSTLAASFFFSGYPLLSDDCLLLKEDRGQILATPAYPGLRLWEDALKAVCDESGLAVPMSNSVSKRRLVFTEQRKNFPADPQPLAGIYSLVRPAEQEKRRPPDAPTIEPLSARDGFMELVACAFNLDITDRAGLSRQFDFFGLVLSRVPVRRLSMPTNLSVLPASRDAVLADLRRI